MADAQHLHLFRDEVFDFVVCSEILEHLKSESREVLSQINRILKKDGDLIVTVPNGVSPYSFIYDHLRNKIICKVFPRIPVSEHIQMFTFSGIAGPLQQVGFIVVAVEHSDFLSFLPILKRFDKLCYLDCKLADKLPHLLVSGFYFACKKG